MAKKSKPITVIPASRWEVYEVRALVFMIGSIVVDRVLFWPKFLVYVMFFFGMFYLGRAFYLSYKEKQYFRKNPPTQFEDILIDPNKNDPRHQK